MTNNDKRLRLNSSYANSLISKKDFAMVHVTDILIKVRLEIDDWLLGNRDIVKNHKTSFGLISVDSRMVYIYWE